MLLCASGPACGIGSLHPSLDPVLSSMNIGITGFKKARQHCASRCNRMLEHAHALRGRAP